MASKTTTGSEIKTFIVVRHGSNAANQSMRLRMVLGTIQGESRDAAWRAASERWTVYNNQHIELIDLGGRSRREDREAAYQADIYAD